MAVRAGRWGKAAIPLATKFTGKRLGIPGLDRIGRAIAKRASGFDVAIAYTDQRAFDDVPYRFEPALAALARDCDILVVAAAGGPASQGLVNREILDAIGPDGILVNVARGSVVDESALVDALHEGRLGGAGLDVFEDEPQARGAVWLGAGRSTAAPSERHARDPGSHGPDSSRKFGGSVCGPAATDRGDLEAPALLREPGVSICQGN